MVWTVITRCEHTRRYARYPSDLTDNEWGVVVPFVPPGRGGGRPRTTDMREVLNAILYLAEGGISWRMLPKDFPPVSTVRRYFYQWRDDGTLSFASFAAPVGPLRRRSGLWPPGPGVSCAPPRSPRSHPGCRLCPWLFGWLGPARSPRARGYPRAPGAGGFHSYTKQLAVRAEPAKHRPVAGPGGGERFVAEHRSLQIHNGGGVQVLVGIDATDDLDVVGCRSRHVRPLVYGGWRRAYGRRLPIRGAGGTRRSPAPRRDGSRVPTTPVRTPPRARARCGTGSSR